MLTNSKAMLDNVLTVLRNDAALAGYVKSFSVGGMNCSHNLFPFIDIGDFSYRAGDLGAASVWIIYDIDIYAGVKNLAPGLAYQGSESGVKGICDLCEDILRVTAGNTFNNTFIVPVSRVQNNPRYLFDKAETICIGKVSFTGKAFVRHR